MNLSPQASVAAESVNSEAGFSLFRSPVFMMAVLLIVVGVLSLFLNKPEKATIAAFGAAALCLVITFAPLFKSVKAFGVEAELREQKEKIDQIDQAQKGHSEDINSMTLTLIALVSKYEINHLINLEKNEPYKVRYQESLKGELKRLDDFGFILPKTGMGLNTLDEKFGGDLNKYRREDKTEFDLRDYVHLTSYGKRYLDIWRRAGSPDRMKKT